MPDPIASSKIASFSLSVLATQRARLMQHRLWQRVWADAIERRLFLGFLAVVFLLIGVLVSTATINDKRSDLWIRISHAQEVEGHIERLRADLLAAESNERGYVLTRDGAFRRMSEAAGKRASGRTLNELRGLTADNPRQQEALRRLTPIVAHRVAIVDSILKQTRKGNLDTAIAAIRSEDGKRAMDEADTILTAMKAEEDRLLRQRTAARVAFIAWTNVLEWMMYSLILGTLAVVFLRVRTVGRERKETRDTLASAQALAHVGSWETFLPSGRVRWSEEMFRLHGWEPGAAVPSLEEMIGRVHPSDRARLQYAVDAAIEHGTCSDFEYRITLPDGDIRSTLARIEMQKTGSGERRLLGTLLDITQRKFAEDSVRRFAADLQAERDFNQAILDHTGALIVVTDAEGRIIQINRSAAQLIGRSEESVRGVPFWDVLLVPEIRARRQRAFQSRIAANDLPYQVETECLAGDGGRRHVAWTCAGVAGTDGRVGYMIASGIDITARLQAQAEIERTNVMLERAYAEMEILAQRDALTGLCNRRVLDERLREEWERIARYGENTGLLSLILLDVDKFKQYNDTFGHPAGDEVLRQVAKALQKVARTTDVVARYGGEEFAILLPETGRDGAQVLAERLREAVADLPLEHRRVTASFGVATISPIMPDTSALITAADSALYESKANGRNCVTMR